MVGVTRQPRDRSAPVRGGDKAGLVHDVTWSWPGEMTPRMIAFEPDLATTARVPMWMPFRTPITVLKIAFSCRVGSWTSFGTGYGPEFRLYERDRYAEPAAFQNQIAAMKVRDDVIPGFDPFDMYQTQSVGVTSYQPCFFVTFFMNDAYATDPDSLMIGWVSFTMYYRFSNDFDLGA